jgi:hypothetical protein
MESTFNEPEIHDAALADIRKSAGWMKFIAILSFIILFVGIISMVLLGSVFLSYRYRMPQLGLFGAYGGLLLIIIAVFMGIFIYQNVSLLKAAGSAQKVGHGDLNETMQKYAVHFKNYFILSVVFGAVGILFSVILLFTKI